MDTDSKGQRKMEDSGERATFCSRKTWPRIEKGRSRT